MDSLACAIQAAATPARHVSRSQDASHAAIIGMAATAAEQAISSILVQVDGDEAVLTPDGKFKTASHVLEDVTRLLSAAPVARATFLTAGVSDHAVHRRELLGSISSFSLLVKQRAAALHGGYGVTKEVADHTIHKVHRFLALLAQSQRIKPYLASLPDVSSAYSEPFVILDDLVAKFQKAGTPQQKGAILRQLFLVLPNIPSNAPDWLAAFERVVVVPVDGDIRLLVTTLQQAQPARLARLSGGGRAISVRITREQAALPIELQALRAEFRNIEDQIGADIAIANGRLSDGLLDLPPDRVMAGLFAMSERKLTEVFGVEDLTAHMAWPFIAAAVSTTGTSRPYWFLVRRVRDLGQLRAQLLRAADAGSRPALSQKLTSEVVAGIDAIERQRQLAPNDPLVAECRERNEAAIAKASRLQEAVERGLGTSREISAFAREAVTDFAIGFGSASEAWAAIEQDAASQSGNTAGLRTYWARMLAEATADPNDVTFLTNIVLDAALSGAHTAARQALRLIDAMRNGPSMELG
ncbi:hypothetical protein OVA13_11770 [Pseudoxanthomonas sp. SL93]|uniref:hypothetical protein n=1 Tax=Pseudoxanthomonas sp. SL93 TaxID=2995142 RepID=UPI00226DD732|nr:hypothetical protein [Pseudoxanthomonas sp. SL93]WAC62079.1 hypothetical protein OVA13_11770 [Pseudoxanthomonas sp. SL93]